MTYRFTSVLQALSESCQLKLTCREGEASGFSAVLELCSNEQQPVRRHVLLPSHPFPIPAEDVQYLQRKGAFCVPQSETCKSLLRAYFHHIHPLMPVVDAASAVPMLVDGRAARFNLLLLWSLFFSATTVSYSHALPIA